MANIFTKHPNSVGETYFQHLRFAMIIGLNMVIAGFGLIIHSIFPFLFPTTGSSALLKLTQRIVHKMPKERIQPLAENVAKKMEETDVATY